MNTCPYCGDPMTNPRRKQCGKPGCKRAFNAERMRDWQRKYRADTGQWYARAAYGDAQREYHKRRRQELGHWRQRYPAAASASDARRRMRIQQATTGEPVVPALVHARDRWTCQLCRLPIDPKVAWPDPMSATVDHIVPLAQGGLHSMSNVQSAHASCNSRKGDKIMDLQSKIVLIISQDRTDQDHMGVITPSP